MMTKQEYNKIVDDIGKNLITHFTPAFAILQTEKERISQEFKKIAEIINNNDQFVSELEKRIIRLENRLSMDHRIREIK